MSLFCKDCKYINGWPGSFVTCSHPENMTKSPVDGYMRPKQSIEWCREDGHCKEAANFQAREPDTHDDKPSETACNKAVSTQEGDLDGRGRALRPGT